MTKILKSVGLAAATISLVCAGSVYADTVTAVIGGEAQSGANYINFDSLSSGETGSISLATGVTLNLTQNAAADGGSAPWLSGNNNVNFESPSTLPVGGEADPTTWVTAGSTDAAGSATFTFTTAQNYFGLVWGSVDAKVGGLNTLTFYSGAPLTSTVVATVTGDSLTSINPLIDISPWTGGFQSGDTTDPSGTAYVNIDTTLSFESVVASSSQYTFEIENVAYGSTSSSSSSGPSVPDGGMTVALLGGALVGLQVLRRKLFC